MTPVTIIAPETELEETIEALKINLLPELNLKHLGQMVYHI